MRLLDEHGMNKVEETPVVLNDVIYSLGASSRA